LTVLAIEAKSVSLNVKIVKIDVERSLHLRMILVVCMFDFYMKFKGSVRSIHFLTVCTLNKLKLYFMAAH